MDNTKETQNINVATGYDRDSSIITECSPSASPPKASDSSPFQKENIPENEPSNDEFGALEGKRDIGEVSEPSKPSSVISEMQILKEINKPSSSSQSICSNPSETVEERGGEDKERKPLQIIWQYQEELNTPAPPKPTDDMETPFRRTVVKARKLDYSEVVDEESDLTQPETKPEESFKIWHDSF